MNPITRLYLTAGILLWMLANFLIVSATAMADQTLPLNGAWQVHLDPDAAFDPTNLNTASHAQWSEVSLPGALRDSSLGNPVGPDTKWIGDIRQEFWNQPQFAPYRKQNNFKVPFWLQPERHFVGTAWYRKTIVIPATWKDQRVTLHLERPHWQTKLFVDAVPIGENDSLSIPHTFDLTTQLSPGQHTLTIGIDNSLAAIDVGLNAHSVSDHTQSAWHGIVGDLSLRATPRVAVKHTEVFARPSQTTVRTRVHLTNQTDQPQRGRLQLSIEKSGQTFGRYEVDVELPVGDKAFDLQVPVSTKLATWDEFHPTLYQLNTQLRSDSHSPSMMRTTFGVREIRTAGGQLLLNDRPIFLRGTLECCIFPLTGYPPTDVNAWKRIIQVCKSHGLNHLRFHSWCPPQAAFDAADELGFYYQVECSTWPNQSVSLGLGKPIDQWLYREADRIISTYGSHPSFMLLAAGNEPSGPGQGGQYLDPWVAHFNAQDDRMIVTGGSGWPILNANQFHVLPQPRIHQWGQGLKSRINRQSPETITDYRDIVSKIDAPVVSHEIGQWCVYPNFDEIKKYTGSLKPKNFEIFRDFLDEAGMLDQANDFLMASGKLQTLCYKEEIESSLRTPNFGGFQLLDLHDFPGQGTALVGMLDPFWDSKPYLTPQEFRRFCGPVVPLARLPKRTWSNDEPFNAEVEVSHFGNTAIENVTPDWSLLAGDKTIASGRLNQTTIAPGGLRRLGRIQCDLSQLDRATKCTLQVSINNTDANNGDQTIVNDWDIWVYPTPRPTSSNAHDVLIVSTLDEQALKRLSEGGKVLFMADPRAVKTDVQIGFSPIFWNSAWTDGQPPHTLGILCDPQHPALRDFPTDYHSDWQWWDVVSRSATMVLDGLPTQLTPIISVVPDWFAPKRLALAIEARVGDGKLLVCSMGLNNEDGIGLPASQMKASIEAYVHSDAFAPKVELSGEQVRGLFRELPYLQKIGAVATSDSEQVHLEAANAIDGDPNTLWHTQWSPEVTPIPHWLQIDLQTNHQVKGIRYVPRGDKSNGRIAKYEVHVSQDATNWTTAASGNWSDDNIVKTVAFANPSDARYIKIVALSEVKRQNFSSIAEMEILFADPVSSSPSKPTRE
jgi:hypothetical protein